MPSQAEQSSLPGVVVLSTKKPSLQAEQELLISGVDPSLGNARHSHNVASLRQEDAEGHVTIQTAQGIAYEQDECLDSEDEDMVGQRATVKLRSSPKKRPSVDLDSTKGGTAAVAVRRCG